MLDGISSSLSGMAAAQNTIETAAHNIANLQTSNFVPIRSGSDGNPQSTQAVSSETSVTHSGIEAFQQTGGLVPSKVDLTTEMTNMVLSKRAFQANAAALKSQDEALGSLLDQTT